MAPTNLGQEKLWFVGVGTDNYIYLEPAEGFIPIAGGVIPAEAYNTAPSGTQILFVFNQDQSSQLRSLYDFLNSFGGEQAEFFDLTKRLILAGLAVGQRFPKTQFEI